MDDRPPPDPKFYKGLLVGAILSAGLWIGIAWLLGW
jgi:hypothetical protein